MKRRTVFHAYIGNVSTMSAKGSHHDKVVWEKGRKYSEYDIAGMLNKAYRLGRSEALSDIAGALAEASVK